MRCLGLTNSPMAMSRNGKTERHSQHSPNARETRSPPSSPPPRSTSISRSPTLSPVPDAIKNPHNASASGSKTEENGFTLMHPAFQGAHSRQQLTMNEKHGHGDTFPMTSTPNEMYAIEYHAKMSAYNANQYSSGNYAMNNKINYAVDKKRSMDSSVDDDHSSDSEEIDLTTNVCIDFSNNNNKQN